MKRKGFTLVELLAVIAILAILVIIALPNIMEMFNTAKENSFKTEVKEIFKTAQQTWMQDSMYNTGNQVYSRCEDGCDNGLDLSGRTDLDYCIKLDKSGKVTEYYATDGTFTYSYSDGDLKVEEINSVEKVTSSDSKLTCDGFVLPLPTGDPNQGAYFNPYKNNRNGEHYGTLKAAFDNVENNQTIKVLKTVTTGQDSSNPKVSSEKTGIKFDLNGFSVAIVGGSTNLGELEVINSSNTNATLNYGIENSGTLKINGTKSASKITIVKKRNYGGLINNANGTLTIVGNVEIKDDYGNGPTLTNRGTATITDTIVTAGTNGDGSSNSAIKNTGVMNINGENTQISSLASSSNAIDNSGTLNISAGTINGKKYGLNNTSNTATISGGNISGDTYGIYLENSSSVTITGGTITGTTNGIRIYTGTVTLGTNDSNANTTSPLVQATKSTGTGIVIGSGNTLNFYDGIVKGAAGKSISTTGTINIPDYHQILKETVDGVESAIIVRNAN